ncbi:MAG TPA: protein translocase subunit SecD [Cellulomonas sp.]
MAPPPRRRHPARTLLTLGVLGVAVFGTVFAGTKLADATWTPKLALDLEGGTQIILTPVTDDESSITSDTIDQAIEVIRQRVDSSGVSEAEITSQGGTNIVVSLPGRPSEETLDLVRTSAQMEFRPVLTYGSPEATTDTSATATATATTDATESATDDATAAATAEATADATAEATAEPTDEATPESASDSDYYITDEVQAEYDALDCTDSANLTGGSTSDPDAALVTCSQDGSAKYILGPVEVEGSRIKTASSGLQTTSSGATTNEWVVNLEFDSEGAEEFKVVTQRLQGLDSPMNQFGIVLDGLVVSAPSLDEGTVISDGKAVISGSFTRDTATTLANQLKFGALPISFEVQSEEQISATLGSEQLEKGLIAGLIGLLLVVLYSMFQYRALGLVTVASLVIAAVLTYGVITLLSWLQGYRLSLPGVAGLIVAIGITADSFIVYFERIRDELREGRTLVAAVDRGWERARRTILASDAVNFLAAVVLYLLAVGSVRGFAFTLGLTTVLDLLIVFTFTHPVMLLLAKTEFFAGGHRFSGLDPSRLGVAGGTRYVGRGRIASGPRTAKADGTGPLGDADALSTLVETPQGATIAERRAAAAKAAAATAAGAEGDASGPSTDEGDTSTGDGSESSTGTSSTGSTTEASTTPRSATDDAPGTTADGGDDSPDEPTTDDPHRRTEGSEG